MVLIRFCNNNIPLIHVGYSMNDSDQHSRLCLNFWNEEFSFLLLDDSVSVNVNNDNCSSPQFKPKLV